MSAPATKARSPAPVNTTAATRSSWRSAVRAACRSTSTWRLTALRTSGRLIVTSATASSTSTLSVA
jgi:hypothetical protein